jgi:hypothetical protein
VKLQKLESKEDLEDLIRVIGLQLAASGRGRLGRYICLLLTQHIKVDLKAVKSSEVELESLSSLT